ncbi:MAG: hypothetical protein JRJ65_07395 [Deltaproteobacteria bacterium]|nr:hypothetical protein [Deltaproteobacteria bacterium]
MTSLWKKKDILITVKTYPEYSIKYTETVCTCGILADTKQLIRIYPIRFRYLDGEYKFSKYQWINAEIRKSKKDSRPESYNIKDDSIKLGPIIDTNGNGWVERERWVLSENNYYNSLEELQNVREGESTSLGIIRPKSIKGCKIVNKNENEIKVAELRKKSIMAQLDMLTEKQELELLPFRFSLEFCCDHELCKGHKLSILDWEIAELYRKLKNKTNWKEIIIGKVMDGICGEQRDTYLFLGNMAQHQHVFCVLGFFWPPKQRQLKIDFN